MRWLELQRAMSREESLATQNRSFAR